VRFTRKKTSLKDYLSASEYRWDFEKRYPVLRVDYAGETVRKPQDLNERLSRLPIGWEHYYQTKKNEGSPGERL